MVICTVIFIAHEPMTTKIITQLKAGIAMRNPCLMTGCKLHAPTEKTGCWLENPGKDCNWPNLPTSTASGVPSELSCCRERLIRHAATLLMQRLSDIDEDYPKRFPKHVLRDIEKHNELLRVIAIDLRSIADFL